MYKYRLVLTWSEREQRWIAEVPELPYTAGDGATPEEAIAFTQTLIEEWMMVAHEQGEVIPVPRTYEQYDQAQAGGSSVAPRAKTSA